MYKAVALKFSSHIFALHPSCKGFKVAVAVGVPTATYNAYINKYPAISFPAETPVCPWIYITFSVAHDVPLMCAEESVALSDTTGWGQELGTGLREMKSSGFEESELLWHIKGEHEGFKLKESRRSKNTPLNISASRSPSTARRASGRRVV